MAFKDLLLYLPTYPDAAAPEAADRALALCAGLGAAITAVAFEVRFTLSHNRLADALLHIDDLAAAEEKRTAEVAAELLARFERGARDAGLPASIVTLKSETYEIPGKLAALARTRDLCVIPYGKDTLGQRIAAEAVIFGSGRPALVIPAQSGADESSSLGSVLIAWDGSRAAARAVADAMPLLTAASAVRVLTIVDEKKTAGRGAAAELVRHLAAHGVAATVDEAEGSSTTGIVLERIKSSKVDLLVMGAFGRSGIREFVLGGVTDDLLERPPVPILLSH